MMSFMQYVIFCRLLFFFETCWRNFWILVGFVLWLLKYLAVVFNAQQRKKDEMMFAILIPMQNAYLFRLRPKLHISIEFVNIA